MTLYAVVLNKPSDHAWAKVRETWPKHHVLDERVAFISADDALTGDAEPADNVTQLDPLRSVSGGGNGGNGGVLSYRLGEVERRVAALESKVSDVNDTCIKIDAKMEEAPSKSFVIWFGIGLLSLSVLTLLGHLLIRYLGAPLAG